MSMKMLYVVALFAGATITQAGAIFLLPMTKGATVPLPTLGMLSCFLVFAILCARLSAAGVGLSILTPLMGLLGPLTGIAIGTLVYGEAASLGKIGILLAGCVLVLLAGLVG